MIGFRLFLLAIILVVAAYTAPVLLEHGIVVLLPSFFGVMRDMGWQGQFNLDFFMFLLLSGFWIAWRNEFSATGIALGVGGVLLGAPYLAAYLLFLSYQTRGNISVMLLGAARLKAGSE